MLKQKNLIHTAANLKKVSSACRSLALAVSYAISAAVLPRWVSDSYHAGEQAIMVALPETIQIPDNAGPGWGGGGTREDKAPNVNLDLVILLNGN